MHHSLGAAIQLGWNSLRQRSYLRDAHLAISSAIMNVENPSVFGTGNAS
jgi:hypothetical protein